MTEKQQAPALKKISYSDVLTQAKLRAVRVYQCLRKVLVNSYIQIIFYTRWAL